MADRRLHEVRAGLGMEAKMGKRSYVDLTGRRFSRLLVLRRAPSIRNHPAYCVVCDCGEERVVTASHLLDGETTSCGCWHRENKANSPEDFWKKVEKADGDRCWPWVGACRNQRGYGIMSFERRLVRAHRLAWTLAIGPIPSGMCVLHRCDNPPCCNPAHLFLGAHADNMADMVMKGRRPKTHGERNPRAKLTAADVAEIRRLLRSGARRPAVGRLFGVAVETIRDIATGQNWRSVGQEAQAGGGQ